MAFRVRNSAQLGRVVSKLLHSLA